MITNLAKTAAAVLVGVGLFASGPAAADGVPVKFTLDWKFEGPSAPYLLAHEKGYFDAAGLDVSIDSGNGSSGAVTRVASGAYDIGFADINSLIDFNAKNPDQAMPGVFMVYDHPPFAIFALKKSGIAKPEDLIGKKLGAPVFDSARKTWPAFASATGLDAGGVEWLSMDPPLREPMLVRGDVDAISGFYFTSVLNLENAGIGMDDLTIFKYSDYGVNLYGNTIIVAPDFAKEHPELVKGFLGAVAKGWKEAIADPAAAIQYVKNRDGLIDVDLEIKRLELAIGANVLTPSVKENGIGAIDPARLEKAIAEVAASFNLEAAPTVDQVFDASYLPAPAERMVQ